MAAGWCRACPVAEALRAGILGCGNVASRYAETMSSHPQVILHCAADRNLERARSLTERFGGLPYGSLDELLGDDAVDVVVNLTRQSAHAATTATCLRAGKHVYSEKPLALNGGDATELLRLASLHGARLACAPAAHLGEAQSRAWKIVRSGTIGPIRAAYAEANWGRIESWHPRPVEFYDAGPMLDVGIYPISLLTAMFGPVTHVRAHGRVLLAQRCTRGGQRFSLRVPDLSVAWLDFAGGACARVTASFYTPHGSKQQGLELHGDDGSLFLDSWHAFDAQLELAMRSEPYVPLAADHDAYPGYDYARGLAELVSAILEGRPHRNPAAHAAHVVDVIEAIDNAISRDRSVPVSRPEGWRDNWAVPPDDKLPYP